MSGLVERLLPWYKADEQLARTARTAALVATAQAALQHAAEVQSRSALMVKSYERAQERLCKH